VRVLDLTRQVAGPSATLMLAFLGAEVVKVIPGSRDSYDATPLYLNNASKKSIELDLKSETERETAKELARKADVFVEDFSPGASTVSAWTAKHSATTIAGSYTRR
jgi:crotonobetainyl-CoA:carnitine CoA-transferase CaiB-like acyl-CoA transferase